MTAPKKLIDNISDVYYKLWAKGTKSEDHFLRYVHQLIEKCEDPVSSAVLSYVGDENKVITVKRLHQRQDMLKYSRLTESLRAFVAGVIPQKSHAWTYLYLPYCSRPAVIKFRDRKIEKYIGREIELKPEEGSLHIFTAINKIRKHGEKLRLRLKSIKSPSVEIGPYVELEKVPHLIRTALVPELIVEVPGGSRKPFLGLFAVTEASIKFSAGSAELRIPNRSETVLQLDSSFCIGCRTTSSSTVVVSFIAYLDQSSAPEYNEDGILLSMFDRTDIKLVPASLEPFLRRLLSEETAEKVATLLERKVVKHETILSLNPNLKESFLRYRDEEWNRKQRGMMPTKSLLIEFLRNQPDLKVMTIKQKFFEIYGKDAVEWLKIAVARQICHSNDLSSGKYNREGDDSAKS
ncbi:MAG: hypothetical protein ACP5KW_07980 [Thermoproteota archaeon]|jgi:hypothetical protein